MKYSAIDIGSNTVQMMIAESQGKELTNRRTWLRTTRLGSGAQNDRLTPEAISDTVEAVRDFYQLIRSEGDIPCRILATSAVRDAENKQELITALAKNVPGSPMLEILPGEAEALTSFLGVQSSLSAPKDWPVVDLGGSSTELIYSQGDKLHCVSGNIGAVRAHARGWDQQQIEAIVRSTYQRLNQADTLIGVGGTITSAAGVLAGLQSYDRSRIEGADIRLSQLQDLYRDLLPLSLPQRCQYSPLLVKRGEIIQEGLEILFAIMEFLEIEKLCVCGGGILDGAIWQQINL